MNIDTLSKEIGQDNLKMKVREFRFICHRKRENKSIESLVDLGVIEL